jgi:hypothetical protein
MFKPGQSGNPRGRPSHQRTFRELLIRIGAEKIGPLGSAMTRLEIACRRIWDAAIDPQSKLSAKDQRAALMFIVERMEGKPFAAEVPGAGKDEVSEFKRQLRTIAESLKPPVDARPENTTAGDAADDDG